LSSPFIKFEVTNCAYKPVFAEFKKFPQMYFTGRPGKTIAERSKPNSGIVNFKLACFSLKCNSLAETSMATLKFKTWPRF